MVTRSIVLTSSLLGLGGGAGLAAADHGPSVTVVNFPLDPAGIYVAANQPAAGSFAHAIPADGLQLRCLDGATCTVLISAAGY